MLGAMTSLTGGGGLQGGSAGPSTATNTSNTTNNSGFTGGAINMGSGNGIPSWAIVAMVLAGLYVLFGKK